MKHSSQLEDSRKVRLIILSSFDSLSKIVLNGICASNDVEIVGLVKTKVGFRKRLKILRDAYKKKAIWYALYIQLELLFSKILLITNDLLSFSCKNQILKIPQITVTRLDEQSVFPFSSKLKSDLFLSIRPGLIFKKSLIRHKQKILNLHCSLLPSHGGIAGVLQAIAANDESLGISFHLITSEKIDDGPIILQKEYKSNNTKSVFSHTMKLYCAAACCLQQEFRLIFKNINSFSFVENDRTRTYNSWPSMDVYKNMKLNGHSLFDFKDLLKSDY